jgi:hypothetical protein
MADLAEAKKRRDKFAQMRFKKKKKG